MFSISFPTSLIHSPFICAKIITIYLTVFKFPMFSPLQYIELYWWRGSSSPLFYRLSNGAKRGHVTPVTAHIWVVWKSWDKSPSDDTSHYLEIWPLSSGRIHAHEDHWSIHTIGESLMLPCRLSRRVFAFFFHSHVPTSHLCFSHGQVQCLI